MFPKSGVRGRLGEECADVGPGRGGKAVQDEAVVLAREEEGADVERGSSGPVVGSGSDDVVGDVVLVAE